MVSKTVSQNKEEFEKLYCTFHKLTEDRPFLELISREVFCVGLRLITRQHL
uniref:Uncharacterized protein n=1 Tax=Anguilla anguilla TaxID=7936 RepID=A0A0E9QKV0_ANGAN